MGIVLSVNEQQARILKNQDEASAELVFYLIESGRYKVKGSCLFETGNELEGYREPETDRYIDLFMA